MVDKTMCGLEWGRLYELYHTTPYSIDHLTARVKALLADEAVRCPRNVYEYVLGGETDTALLDVRFFEQKDKKAAYKRQTEHANKMGVSNCPCVHWATMPTRLVSINSMKWMPTM